MTVTNNKTLDAALNQRMHICDLGENVTIKQFIKEILLAVWDEKESFNGKRPFGNSGWEHGIFISLLIGGFIEGRIELDEDGEVLDFDFSGDEANAFVFDLIHRIFETSKTN